MSVSYLQVKILLCFLSIIVLTSCQKIVYVKVYNQSATDVLVFDSISHKELGYSTRNTILVMKKPVLVRGTEGFKLIIRKKTGEEVLIRVLSNSVKNGEISIKIYKNGFIGSL